MVSVHRTVGATFVADDSFELPPLTQLMTSTDGLALRRRTGGDDPGWRLNGPASSDARSEVRLPVGRSRRTVPTQLQQMVWARSLGAALQPVVEIVTDRTVTRLVDGTGQMVAQ